MSKASRKEPPPGSDFQRWIGKEVIVKFNGGRQVTGTLRGVDMLVNLVLDDAKEQLRDPNDPYSVTEETRDLGVIVCRGPSVVFVHPADGCEEVANPWAEEPVL